MIPITIEHSERRNNREARRRNRKLMRYLFRGNPEPTCPFKTVHDKYTRVYWRVANER